MRPYAPLATLYAASHLRAAGYEVALFDAVLADGEEELAAALDHHRPRFFRALRGQLQLPQQDVPGARAGRRLPDGRHGPWGGRHRARRPVPTSPTAPTPTSKRESSTPSRRGGARPARAARRFDRAARRARSRPWPGSLFPDAAGAVRRTLPARARASPGHLSLPGLGPPRRRTLPRGLESGPRPLQPQPGDHPRLPVPLQLVREADLGAALRHALAGQCRRGDGSGQAHAGAGPPLVRRRHLRSPAALGGRASPARSRPATP